MFSWIATPESWLALATLTILEIVLGIDNIIFVAILVAKLPAAQREFARKLGIGLAMVARLGLLFSIAWVMGLTEPWFSVFGFEFSGRDIILIGGGLFLIFKSTHEIHNSLEGEGAPVQVNAGGQLFSVLSQIILLDIIFSLDSVITAVGLVDQVSLMATAIVISVGIMLLAAKPIGDFVELHPTIKILALSFLMLVGLTLMVEGFDVHVPKGYIYFSMAFSMFVETINLKMRKRKNAAIKLRETL
jgi:predicted tellurium resistance membrane protein TerC